MQLVITLGDQLHVEIKKTQPDEEIRYADVLPVLMSTLHGFTEEHFSHVQEEYTSKGIEEDFEGYKDFIYEKLVCMFDSFLDELFPESKEGAFDLTDAAVVYAQDKIIEEAHEQGLTYSEALEVFEKKAKEYVAAKKMS